MGKEQTLQILAERIEKIEKTLEHMHYDIEELVYLPEERIKKSYVEKVERAAKEEKYKHYKSPKEFFEKLEKENV